MNNRKEELRKKLIYIRTNIDKKFKKEKKINETLCSLISYKNEVVAGYFPYNSEVDVMPFLNHLEKKKIILCLPFIREKNSYLLFKLWKPDFKLVEGKYKIMTPENNHFCEPTSIIIPLLGFDINKNRLGYGGGFYDRTIEFLEKKKKVLKIGVAFEEQEINTVPSMKYDKKLDLIVTPNRVIK